MGQRFLDFCDRFRGHFRQQTRTVETAAQQYVQGLIQAETKNMERMEEGVPETDHQTLQHMVSESAWSERAVLDQMAQDANRLLGGMRTAPCSLMTVAYPRRARTPLGWADSGAVSWAKSRTAKWGCLPR